jgi:hypothetical protein
VEKNDKKGGSVVIGDIRYKYEDLDPEGKIYTWRFFPMNCGGNAMDEIIKAGNAFVFATKLRSDFHEAAK